MSDESIQLRSSITKLKQYSLNLERLLKKAKNENKKMIRENKRLKEENLKLKKILRRVD